MVNASQSWHSWAYSAFGVHVSRTPTMEELADVAAAVYWQRRSVALRPDRRKTPRLSPTPDPRCGSEPGYAAHGRRNETACAACKAAYATVSAIRRRRRILFEEGRLASPYQPRVLKPCGTPGARERHRLRGETCPPCEEAAREYFHQKYLDRLAAQGKSLSGRARPLAHGPRVR